ncbi:D-methionine transport system ATP-binding protein [Virgibacillus halotolerans]|uniref:methionine ABC transporter ATP-binding protein n=1 Tax=Virgibacillus halotolerans TaxID=1071053 RepID=UPI00195FDFBD|nr:methionine ABC transporter ATP-binding protein [Virgibacillus halotolerans]MBM7599270.1 D-methionine transport system ATP-binding protein [Virgibacillus halotolerans]
MIHFENITKVFDAKSKETKALDDVSLHVKKGTIFGVIGYSGAGKSTLVRMANLLEKPTTGKVYFKGTDLTTLSMSKLQEARRNMGMIFQSFNLLKTGTVYENIANPLKLTGVPKKEIQARVAKYLEIVGLQDKANAYPAKLSGGQKQRVAIARALAHEPEVLLCDEATSALDPDTTDAILSLLDRINQELGITILLITHEMNVVQNICHEVAVMDNGRIIEQGKVIDVFAQPKTKTAKRFVQSLFNDSVPEQLVNSLEGSGQIVTLSFVGESSGKPALAMVTKQFDVYPSILSGNIAQLKDQPFGRLVVHLQGNATETQKAISYLIELGVIVEGYKKGGKQHVS